MELSNFSKKGSNSPLSPRIHCFDSKIPFTKAVGTDGSATTSTATNLKSATLLTPFLSGSNLPRDLLDTPNLTPSKIKDHTNKPIGFERIFDLPSKMLPFCLISVTK